MTRRKTPEPNPDVEADEVASGTAPVVVPDVVVGPGDPGSLMQFFEDDRDWHHDQRHAEGHDVCPECGTELGSSG